eukprot:s386_g25.t1
MHDWWTQQIAQQAPDQRTALTVLTWFLNYPQYHQYQRCDEGRLVQLPDYVGLWLQQCAETWLDRIDPNWPLNFYLVQPVPPATREQPHAEQQVIIVQRSLPTNAANVFTVVDQRQSRARWDFALFAPLVMAKRDVIAAVNYDAHCFPERSQLQCMTCHGDFEIRDPVALRNRRGLSYVLIYNDIPVSTQTLVDPGGLWDEDDDFTELLQHSAKSSSPRVLQLESLLPTTMAVRIIDGSGVHRLPNPLEVACPGDSEQVRQELQHWGHQCDVFQYLPHAIFLCVDHQATGDEEVFSEGPFHYVLCHENVEEGPECLFHSSRTALNEVQLLRSSHRKTSKRLVDFTNAFHPQSPCQLHTGFDTEDLVTLFQSGLGILDASFDQLDLPEALAAELQQYEIVPLRNIEQLDHYDRLLLFMDGSSLPGLRRTVPECADDQGHPDTWAMIVVAEIFGPGSDDSTGAILG